MATLDLAGIITRVCTDLKSYFSQIGHTHSGSDVTSGTGASQVAIGNHTHSGYAASNHSHGDITSGGDITASAPTIASGDKLIINDESASKVTNGPSFGSDTTKYLRNDGSWAVPATGGSAPSPSSASPAMDGMASAGSSDDYARGDHVHPSDTSKADASHTHVEADITDFGNYAAASHTHTESDITDFGSYAPATHTHAASDIDSGTLAVNRGGTGQSSVDTESTISNVISASSGITVSAAAYRKWGKFVQLNVDFKRSSAISNNTSVTVGTVASGKRPVAIASGGNGSSIIAYCNSSGTLSVRNISGSQISANTTINVSICYLIS